MRSFLQSLALVFAAGSALAQGWGVTIPNLQFPPRPDTVTQGCTDPASLTGPACSPAQ